MSRQRTMGVPSRGWGCSVVPTNYGGRKKITASPVAVIKTDVPENCDCIQCKKEEHQQKFLKENPKKTFGIIKLKNHSIIFLRYPNVERMKNILCVSVYDKDKHIIEKKEYNVGEEWRAKEYYTNITDYYTDKEKRV